MKLMVYDLDGDVIKLELSDPFFFNAGLGVCPY